jgi:hypothetical protein
MGATLYSKGLSLVSGAPAARLHGHDGFADVESVQVVLPYGGHDKTPDSVSVRWSRRLSDKDRCIVNGIPVTIEPVTLIHLQADGLASGKALDSVLRRHKSPLWLKEHFERWQTARPNDPASAMLDLLDQRMGKRLPRSWFQRLAKRALEEHGIALVDEWPVFDAAGHRIAELDLANVELMIGVECQSLKYHATPADIAAERPCAGSAGTSSSCGGPISTRWTTCWMTSRRRSPGPRSCSREPTSTRSVQKR